MSGDNPLKNVKIGANVQLGPIGVSIEQREKAPLWEQCEIAWKRVEGNVFTAFGAYFSAQAIAPKGIGPYEAGRSKMVPAAWGPDESNELHVVACHDLIRQLTEDGWEPLSDRGNEWYKFRFQRKIDR